MKPPISYFGGKTALAPWLASLMPEHDAYVEPFCGSAAVLFAKQPARYELVNDVDGELVNFLRVLRDRTDDLVEVCTLTPYARDELEAALSPVNDDLERARRFWIRSTQCYGGRVSNTRSWVYSFEQGAWRPRIVQRRIERFWPTARRLLDVAIENTDALTLLQKVRPGRRTQRVVVYCDPPYPFEARSSGNAEGKRGGYLHEWGAAAQHRALAETLHTIDATVLISCYPNALYDEMYGDWYRVEVPAWNWMAVNTASRGRTTEVVWSNRPLAEQLTLSLTSVDRPDRQELSDVRFAEVDDLQVRELPTGIATERGSVHGKHRPRIRAAFDSARVVVSDACTCDGRCLLERPLPLLIHPSNRRTPQWFEGDDPRVQTITPRSELL